MQKLLEARVKLALVAQAKRPAWRGWFRLARTRPRQRSGWPAGKTFSTVSFWNSPHSAISSDQERYHAEGKPQRTPIRFASQAQSRSGQAAEHRARRNRTHHLRIPSCPLWSKDLTTARGWPAE